MRVIGSATKMLSLSTALASPLAAQRYPPLAEVLRIERPSLAIGEETDEGPALFGTILGVVADGEGHIYVLDGSNHTIKSFTASGQFVHAVGRAGRGPGDVLEPRRLSHDGGSSLFFVDRSNGVSWFSTSAGKLTYRDRFLQELRPVDACTLSGRLVVGANYRGHILHFLTDSFAIDRSVGGRFRQDTQPMIQAQYDREDMLLACDDRDSRVFVAEGHQSIVRAYDASGRLLWENNLPGYSGYSVRMHHELPNSTSYFMGEFSTKTIVLASPERLVIQALHKTQRRRGRDGGLQTTAQGLVTYVLSASTGEIITRSTTAPFFVTGAARDGEAIAFNNDPYPQVFVTRVAQPSERREQ